MTRSTGKLHICETDGCTKRGKLYGAWTQRLCLGCAARQKLDDLGLDESLLVDDSGQTTEHEHIKWLATASDEAILSWSGQMGDVPMSH